MVARIDRKSPHLVLCVVHVQNPNIPEPEYHADVMAKLVQMLAEVCARRSVPTALSV
jgi:hypothetical protein